MRIDKCKSVTARSILQSKDRQETRLSNAGLSNRINVRKAVRWLYAEMRRCAPMIELAEI